MSIETQNSEVRLGLGVKFPDFRSSSSNEQLTETELNERLETYQELLNKVKEYQN